MDNEYKRAARANAAARERGEVRKIVLARTGVSSDPSEVFEKVTGWRKLIIKVRRCPTINTAMAAILPTAEEIREA